MRLALTSGLLCRLAAVAGGGIGVRSFRPLPPGRPEFVSLVDGCGPAPAFEESRIGSSRSSPSADAAVRHRPTRSAARAREERPRTRRPGIAKRCVEAAQTARGRARVASADRGVVSPAHAPARFRGSGGGDVVAQPEVGDGDEAVAAVEKRDTRAHPRHHAGVVEPTLERVAVRPVERPEVLAAGAEAQLETGVEPRLGKPRARGRGLEARARPPGPTSRDSRRGARGSRAARPAAARSSSTDARETHDPRRLPTECGFVRRAARGAARCATPPLSTRSARRA